MGFNFLGLGEILPAAVVLDVFLKCTIPKQTSTTLYFNRYVVMPVPDFFVLVSVEPEILLSLSLSEAVLLFQASVDDFVLSPPTASG